MFEKSLLFIFTDKELNLSPLDVEAKTPDPADDMESPAFSPITPKYKKLLSKYVCVD